MSDPCYTADEQLRRLRAQSEVAQALKSRIDLFSHPNRELCHHIIQQMLEVTGAHTPEALISTIWNAMTTSYDAGEAAEDPRLTQLLGNKVLPIIRECSKPEMR